MNVFSQKANLLNLSRILPFFRSNQNETEVLVESITHVSSTKIYIHSHSYNLLTSFFLLSTVPRFPSQYCFQTECFAWVRFLLSHRPFLLCVFIIAYFFSLCNRQIVKTSQYFFVYIAENRFLLQKSVYKLVFL